MSNYENLISRTLRILSLAVLVCYSSLGIGQIATSEDFPNRSNTISDDGRYRVEVARLFPEPGSILLHDEFDGTTIVVSDGVTNSFVLDASISANGNAVVYATVIDGNNFIVHYDRLTGESVLLSGRPMVCRGCNTHTKSISADGRYTVYGEATETRAASLYNQLYLYDAVARTTTRISTACAFSIVDLGTISLDGQSVAYTGRCPIGGTQRQGYHLYLYDVTTSTNILIENDSNLTGISRISDNGRYVRYRTTNRTLGGINGVAIYDRVLGEHYQFGLSDDCVDTDGDGWGFREHSMVSCQVDTSSAPETDSTTVTQSTMQCVDSDGDGFGWNGIATCDPTEGAGTEMQPQALQCIDSDGDGFGWDGFATCDPTENAAPANDQPIALQCIDTDGDGFGWDGFATCDPSGGAAANNDQPTGLQCIDTDGDGFGWNGFATCDPSVTDSTGSQAGDTTSSNDEVADLDSEPVTGRVSFRNLTDTVTPSNIVTPGAIFGLTDEQDILGTLERLSLTDACSVTGDLSAPLLLTGGFQVSEIDFDIPTVSGGDELTINAGGSLFSLVDESLVDGTLDVGLEGEQIFYNLAPGTGGIAGPLIGATVSIPGSSAVASFTEEVVPNVDPVVVLNSEFTRLDINEGLQWEAPTNTTENSRMTVFARIFRAEPTPANGFPGNNFLQCVLEDDGEFMFPEELTPFVDQQFVDTIRFIRTTWRTVQNGNTTLILLNETSNFQVIPDLF